MAQAGQHAQKSPRALAIERHIARLEVEDPEYLEQQRGIFLDHVAELHPMADTGEPHPFALPLVTSGHLEIDPEHPGKLRITPAGRERAERARGDHPSPGRN